MRLALFDLDDTLIDGDTDVEWSEVLAAHGAMDRERTRAFHEDYRRGTLDIEAFLRFQLEPLAREPMERLLSWRRKLLVERIRPRIRPAARALVREHAAAGHEVVLISATLRFLVEPIAEELSIHHVIASEGEIVDGRHTGRIAGTPCFRAGKIVRLREWLVARGAHESDVRESWFYSDSHNDLPLLGHVTHPVCVRPDRVLAAHAARAGWRVMEMRPFEAESSSPIPPRGIETGRSSPAGRPQIETEYSSPPIG